MKILLIFRFYNYIWCENSENVCFILIHSYFEKKRKEKVLTINIVHFPIFEISASL